MPRRSTTALSRLQENHDAFMERSKTDKKFADDYLQLQEDLKRQHANREQRSQPGRQTLDRTRVVADTPKRQQRDRTEDLSGGKRVSEGLSGGKRVSEGLSGEKRVRIIYGDDAVLQLRERIREHGLKSGEYVQIANDSGQKWFMRIVNGEVVFKDTDDPALASALWCEENDVTKLSSIFTKAETCEIRCIIDAGPISKFGDPVLQLRERIREHGLKSGDYVQIANDSGQKWFMRIVNGEVVFKDTDNPALASALWCKENDVTKLSSIFTKAETCAIRCIIDAGPMSKFNDTYKHAP